MIFKVKSILPILAQSLLFAKSRSVKIDFEEDVAKLPMPMSDMSATYDESTDRIYLVGGCDDPQGNSQLQPDLFVCFSITDKAFSFDPATATFEELPAAPRARYRHTASNVDGKIWLVGGRTIEDFVIPEVDVYDPVEKSWTTIGSLPAELQFSDLASFYHEGFMYALGGYEQNYAAIDTLFRMSSDVEDGLTTEVMAPLAHARGDVHAVGIDDYGYITGGYTHEDGAGGYCVPHSSTERYDIKGNKWETIDDLDTGRADKALVTLNGNILAFGGETKDKSLCGGTTAEYTVALNDVEVLEDPHMDTSSWSTIAETPARTFRFSGASHPPSNAVYTFGGQTFYSPDCECFATSDVVTKYTEIAETSVASRGFKGFGAFVSVMVATAIFNVF